tara:strand:- start:1311 stop:1676 length:366 start_codon:yes stop_codon:yes gene_type:complete
MFWIIYLIGIIENLQHALVGLALVSFVPIVIFSIGYCETSKDQDSRDFKMCKGVLRKVVPTFFILVILASLIPSQKVLALMVIAPAIVENEEIQEEFKDIYSLAKQGLEEMLTDGAVKSNE